MNDQIRALSSSLRVLIYHSMATMNQTVRRREREDFSGHVSTFKNLELESFVGCKRLINRDCISRGMEVVESDNNNAAEKFI